MNEEEFEQLIEASGLGAPRVASVRSSGDVIPPDVRARLEEAVR